MIHSSATTALLIFLLVTTIGTTIGFYFAIRSAMISRIREVGIYRSLGAKKADVVRLFKSESLVVTTISSAMGYFLMTYFLYQIAPFVNQFVDVIQITLISVILGLLFLYALQMRFGISPIKKLLVNTPAEINAKYDL